MRNSIKTGIALLALALLIALTASVNGCGERPASGEGTERIQVKVIRLDIRDYGNGVFYFHSAGSEFGRQFSAWRATHPKWIIIAITADDTSSGTEGYFVIANPDL